MGQEILLERIEHWRKTIDDCRKLIERDRKVIKPSRDNRVCNGRLLELREKILQSKGIEDWRGLIEWKRKIREFQNATLSGESGEITHDCRLLRYERRLMECEMDFRKCDQLFECVRFMGVLGLRV